MAGMPEVDLAAGVVVASEGGLAVNMAGTPIRPVWAGNFTPGAGQQVQVLTVSGTGLAIPAVTSPRPELATVAQATGDGAVLMRFDDDPDGMSMVRALYIGDEPPAGARRVLLWQGKTPWVLPGEPSGEPLGGSDVPPPVPPPSPGRGELFFPAVESGTWLGDISDSYRGEWRDGSDLVCGGYYDDETGGKDIGFWFYGDQMRGAVEGSYAGRYAARWVRMWLPAPDRTKTVNPPDYISMKVSFDYPRKPAGRPGGYWTQATIHLDRWDWRAGGIWVPLGEGFAFHLAEGRQVCLQAVVDAVNPGVSMTFPGVDRDPMSGAIWIPKENPDPEENEEQG